ncbi:PilT/PilU family type 4a pilus ATPase [Echinimonas agarilytica]|uniref:PilT/PilU family type 4a pilus ATPase n=1 Tax=Echinimonas agarilytica TaxID=1215918 RepID=A0AA41W4Q0_9GAMM|nr:PilT/PilU family type 4a pilus ATPase [Echinimonas agarilytica]MCM2678912.1 PilT/PilU family type 4a pilus ATPase [Echinimonas agarilytica]
MELLRPYLQQMVERKGSDLFVTVGVPVSVKAHGSLAALDQNKLSSEDAERLVHDTMNDTQRAEFEVTHECNFAIALNDVGRFRVNVFCQREHLGMVIRRIETKIPDADELQLPPILKDVILSKRGLFLFVGGTGTGKSTSLAALLGFRNLKTSGHILTIEDPIEFVHEHRQCIITQREVGIDTPSFDSALKNSLRQAPDVIMLGEIRTSETMEYALSFAETGHLCIATLHANNANQALDRMLHLVPKEMQDQLLFDLSLNLKAIVAQQLVPTKDGSGRKAAIEVLINTPHVSDLIRRGEVHRIKETMSKSKEQGMQTFDQALYELFKRGDITYADALHAADSANDLRLMIKLADEKEGKGGVLDGVSIDMD